MCTKKFEADRKCMVKSFLCISHNWSYPLALVSEQDGLGAPSSSIGMSVLRFEWVRIVHG